MIVHQDARRGQILYATTVALRSNRRRLAGRATGGRDDKGRAPMPFDQFARAPAPATQLGGVADLMLAAFGGRAWV